MVKTRGLLFNINVNIVIFLLFRLIANAYNRVFIRNDASVNQWLFGSTRAFRWDDFSFPRMHKHGNLIAVIIGAGISLTPVGFRPEIVAGILKVAFLAITSQLLNRRHWPVCKSCPHPFYGWCCLPRYLCFFQSGTTRKGIHHARAYAS
jgi:hypothetical protein